MRSIKVKTVVGRWLTGVIVMSLALVGLSLTPALSTTQAGAAAVGSSSDPFNHALALTLSRQIATLPRVSTALSNAVAGQINQAAIGMSPAAKADFTTLVRAAQAKIRQGLSPSDRARVTASLKALGFTPAQIKTALGNPVLLVSLPVAPQTTPAGSRQVNEPTTATAAPAATTTKPPLAATPAVYGPVQCISHHGSTSPTLDESWHDVVGARLVTVKYIKNWYWNNCAITSPPRYQPPTASFTNLCLGCSFKVTWHDQFWYNYLGHGSRSGYANKVQFTLHQCVGIWLLNQCMADKNINWSLRLHYDGTYSAYYN